MYLHTIKSSKNCKQLFSTYENGFKNFLGKKNYYDFMYENACTFIYLFDGWLHYF